jgi:hypothetical protein
LGKIDKKKWAKKCAKMSRNLQKFTETRAFLAKIGDNLALFTN